MYTTSRVDWNYFDKFDEIFNKFLPATGEGDSMATQAVTAMNKLIYMWYNNGDVFDNVHLLESCGNDISTYANWLATYTNIKHELDKICDARTDGDYELILKNCADVIFDETLLSALSKKKAIGSIYDCDGYFTFEESNYEEDEEDDYFDEDEYDE